MTGYAGWPAPLRDQDLRLVAFEVPVKTQRSSVTVDVLAASPARELVLVCECKSGSNVETEQADKYAAARLTDLVRTHTFHGVRTTSARMEILYACLAENEGRIRQGLGHTDARASLLLVGDRRCRLDAHDASLLTPFDVTVPGPPPRVFDFDEETTGSLIEQKIVAEVVAAMARGETTVTVAALVERLPFHALVHQRRKKALIKLATRVLRAAATSHLREYLDVTPNVGQEPGGVVTIRRSPTGYSPQGQSQAWQRLARQAARRPRSRARGEVAGQMPLSFDDLAEDTEMDET